MIIEMYSPRTHKHYLSVCCHWSWQSLPCSNHARPARSWDGPSSHWLHTHAAGPGSAGVAGRGMTGVSPGGGWAGHPDPVGRGAAVLKVATVGRDPLRAVAHGGGSDCVSSGSLKGEERNTQAGSVCGLLHFTAVPPRLHSSTVDRLSGFILLIASHAPALSNTALFMNQPLWNLEPLHQLRLNLLLRYLSAACEEQSWAGTVADTISEGFAH